MCRLRNSVKVLLLGFSVFCELFYKCEGIQKTIEDMFYEHEDEKNSMIAVPSRDDVREFYEDFYDEMDNWMAVTSSMNIIFFGPSISFMRLDAESILHILVNTKKQLIPISKALLAWDIITDGKTAAFLQGREFLAFGTLLNVVPEEDLYYVNFGDDSVRRFFSNNWLNLTPRKIGILVASYKRYYGYDWYKNSTFVNDLGYLLCGFPPSDFQKITPTEFKLVNVETLNKIYQCSSKQTRLILYEHAIHAEAYGRPYKWSSHEISKLGMLLTLVPEDDIPSIQLEAVTAIDSDVMEALSQSKLEYFTKQQIFRMSPKTRRMFILRMQLKNSLTINQLTKNSSYNIVK